MSGAARYSWAVRQLSVTWTVSPMDSKIFIPAESFSGFTGPLAAVIATVSPRRRGVGFVMIIHAPFLDMYMKRIFKIFPFDISLDKRYSLCLKGNLTLEGNFRWLIKKLF